MENELIFGTYKALSGADKKKYILKYKAEIVKTVVDKGYTEAEKLTGISKPTLLYKMKKWKQETLKNLDLPAPEVKP